MKIRRFNEAVEEGFDEIENEIRNILVDFLDTESLEIEDAYIKYDKEGKGSVTKSVAVSSDGKTRKAKIVKVQIAEGDGLELESEQCLTNFDVIEEALGVAKRFYGVRDDQDINFSIENDYGIIYLNMVVVGPLIKKEEDSSDMIQGWIERLAKLGSAYMKKRPFKRTNWISYSFGSGQSIMHLGAIERYRKIARGALNLGNLNEMPGGEQAKEYCRSLIEIRDEAWEKGFALSVSGGDKQMVLQFKKR